MEHKNRSAICCALPLLLVFFMATPRLKAQTSMDTIRLSLPEMEKRFIDSNFLLLAAHYNVDAQKALIEQARRWDNPVLNTDQVIAANGRFFPYGKAADGSFSGQYYVQVQQLIRTAGKRGKLINLATTNAKLSEWQLADVMRNLRYQLQTDYYTLGQQISTRTLYKEQLSRLNDLLNGMQAQYSAGNIAQKDFLRIQALVIGLEQDITELEKTIADTENDLRTLLQFKEGRFIAPVILAGSIPPVPEADVVLETAKKNNPYYQLQVTQTLFQEQNLTYQKSLRTPDITLGPNFDRNSNFAPNYVGLGISLPLPVLNKNQGNIKSAAFGVKQQQAYTMNAETELVNNVSTAYKKLLLTVQQQHEKQQAFYDNYEKMYSNILDSYRQKQISLLEFLDFFNDYTNARQRLLQQQLNLQLAKAELNYHTGTDLFK
jgi:cobalt-zinc-cadmium efflux system outer membrane protein